MMRSSRCGTLFLLILALCALVACGAPPTSPSAVSTTTVAPVDTTSPDAQASSGARFTKLGGSVSGADVQLSASASTGSPNAGASYSYTFQVKNAGPDVAATAALTGALPAGADYIGATVNGIAGGCDVAGTALTCALGDLPSGSQAVVVVTLGAPVTVGSYTLTASATATPADPNTGNNSVSITIQVKAPSTDTIKVTKCYTNATATTWGQMLIKAASSDPTARLFAYRPDGSLIGEVQNGGGSRYGGTVMPWQPYDPINVTIRSSSGGSITVPTTPFQL